MKLLKRTFLILLLLAIPCRAQSAASFGSLADLSGTGSVVQLTASHIYARWVQLLAPSANTGNVVCCDVAISSTRGAYITAGQPWQLPFVGPYIDLSTVYVLIQSGDKVKVTYQVYP